jgi:hypothetical protein
MPRTLFGIGAIGETIKSLQRTLTEAGFDTRGLDGWYGQDTQKAVGAFQGARSLLVTGLVDDGSWSALMGRPVPTVGERCVQLTSGFEGHGFGLAVGNFDGALLTWGIIGFTLASGELSSIVLSIDQSHPELVQQAFQASTPELLQLVRGSRDTQAPWANEHTLRGGSLAAPWPAMFATFGSYPEVQAEQMRRVASDYLDPAIETARMLDFSSELGLALCFDIHVQDNGIKHTALQQVRQRTTPGMAESDRRELVANAVADWSSPAWREDVRRRKLTVATGQGTVHGRPYFLENWGLSGQLDAPELAEGDALPPSR